MAKTKLLSGLSKNLQHKTISLNINDYVISIML